MNRNLAELAAEKAKLKSGIAHLEARRVAADQLVPVAKVNTDRLRDLLRLLEQNRDRGMTNFAYLQQVTTAAYAAEEKLASVRAERASVDAELRETRSALAEMEKANENLRSAYADGLVLAGASGYVGGGVADPGEVLLPGSKVMEIYTSKPFVLAYLPDTSFVAVEEGHHVQVSSAGRRTLARIEKILPIVEPLPPDFQKPVRARESGQLLRISLSGDDDFLTKQKVHVTGCLIPECAGFGEVASAMVARASVALNRAYTVGIGIAAQELELIMGLAADLPDLVRPANAMHPRAHPRRVAQRPEPTSVPAPLN
jgi:hypothetical protein